MVIRLVLASAVLTLGCGPRLEVHPLQGEDPEILAMLGARPQDLAVPETVRVVQRFHRALLEDPTGRGWDLLSRRTREALNRLAAPLMRTGRSVLATRCFPAPGGPRRVDLVALFLVPRPVRFEARQGGTEDQPDRAQVAVRNAEGHSRLVNLVRERGEWRIDRADLGDLPLGERCGRPPPQTPPPSQGEQPEAPGEPGETPIPEPPSPPPSGIDF